MGEEKGGREEKKRGGKVKKWGGETPNLAMREREDCKQFLLGAEKVQQVLS